MGTKTRVTDTGLIRIVSLSVCMSNPRQCSRGAKHSSPIDCWKASKMESNILIPARKSVLLKLETVDRCGYVHVVSYTKTTGYQTISIRGSIFSRRSSRLHVYVAELDVRWQPNVFCFGGKKTQLRSKEMSQCTPPPKRGFSGMSTVTLSH